MNKTIHRFALIVSLAFTTLHTPAWAEGEAAPAASSAQVPRAVFTSGVQNREPADALTTLGTDARQVYFFTELRGLAGQTVTHRWEHGGNVMSEIRFDVGAPRWRAWSSKTLLPEWTGEWKVVVVDGAGNAIAESSFNYGGANP